LLNSTELQLPVKALFVIFQFVLLAAIGVAPKEANFKNVAAYAIVVAVLLYGIGLRKEFDNGLPDIPMAAAMTVSVLLFLRSLDSPKSRQLIWFAAGCGIVAAFFKQPGLVLAIFSLPLMTAYSVLRRRLPASAIVPAIIALIAGLLWVFGEGSGFQNNQGVIAASRGGRNLAQQLLFAFNRYLLKEPFLLLLFASTLLSMARSRKHLDVLCFLLLPSLAAWFIYGAYEIRLGIHVVCLAALLLAATNYALPRSPSLRIPEGIGVFLYKKRMLLISIVCFMSIVASALESYTFIRKKFTGGYYPYQGGKNTISKYFGKDTEFIYNKIYDRSDILLWIPSNYIYGIFYGHNKVMRPDYERDEKYSLESLLWEIRQYRPDYLFHSGPKVNVKYGPASDLLYDLAEKRCPYLFERVAGPPNYFGYVVYRLRKDDELLARCLK
jgi:hypothetical protein